jgi:hypothetical protein
MAVQHRKQLSRLNIPAASQFDGPHIQTAALAPAHPMALYPPALATAIQASFPQHLSFPAALQGGFRPSTPTNNRHRQTASVANMFGGGFPLPSPSPHPTPFLGHQSQMSTSVPYHLKSKRNTSISIGGPPKAVLGGPQRKLSPLPTLIKEEAVPVAPETKAPPAKKAIVNLPKEVGQVEYEGVTYEDPPWSRKPLSETSVPTDSPQPPEVSSGDEYPPRATSSPSAGKCEVDLPQPVGSPDYISFIH